MTAKQFIMMGVAVVAFAGVGYAQAPRSADRMDELIAEVRALRGELNQAAGVSIRMQVLTGSLSF